MGLTTANAEVKCNIEEGIRGGEDLRNGNRVRNNGGWSHWGRRREERKRTVIREATAQTLR